MKQDVSKNAHRTGVPPQRLMKGTTRMAHLLIVLFPGILWGCHYIPKLKFATHV